LPDCSIVFHEDALKKYVISILLAACSASEAPPAPPPRAVETAHLPWRERVAAELSAIEAKQLIEMMALPPASTTADPRLAAVILDRLARKADPEDVRVALTDALSKTGGRFADALADLFVDENSAKVRAAFVRATPNEQALAILRRAFVDSSTEVRIVAIKSASTHAVCEQLASELRNTLSDREAVLRVEAARSIGALKIAAARGELVRALGDADPEVRLEAMRALDSIAPGSLAGTAVVTALTSDPDTRVAELATKLSSRPQ
jgi:HEAT repeat protein